MRGQSLLRAPPLCVHALKCVLRYYDFTHVSDQPPKTMNDTSRFPWSKYVSLDSLITETFIVCQWRNIPYDGLCRSQSDAAPDPEIVLVLIDIFNQRGVMQLCKIADNWCLF